VAHHRVKNGELVKASRFQVALGSLLHSVKHLNLRVFDAEIRLFSKLRAKPVLWAHSHLIASVRHPGGEMVTTERALDFIDAISVLDRSEIAVGPCVCQKALKRRNGTHIKNMEIRYGAAAHKGAISQEYRDLNPGEAKELLLKFREEGLMHSFYTHCLEEGGRLYTICNCESKICIPVRAQKAAGGVLSPGPDVVSLNSDECVGCGTCVERCHLGNNKLVNGICQVDITKCHGCGVCIPTCKGQARKMSERAGYHPVYYPMELVNKATA